MVTGVWAEGESHRRSGLFYPIEMVRALALDWPFAGLRSDEIRRLRVGAVRWQHEDVRVAGSDEVLSKNAVCFLSIPVNKTSPAFTKPVDRPVGRLSPHGRRSVRISHYSPIERLASWWTCYSRTADA